MTQTSIDTKTVDAQKVLSTSRTVSLQTVGPFIAEALDKLGHIIQAQGIEAAGRPYVVYHDPLGEDDLGLVEVAFPIAGIANLQGADMVALQQHNAGRVAYTTVTLRESETTIRDAFAALHDWVVTHRLRITGPPREVYLAPRRSIGPDDAFIEIQFPVE